MKNFLLFCGNRFYPSGGFNDFVGSYDTLKEAKAAGEQRAESGVYPWAHIVDGDTRLILCGYDLDEGEAVVWE